MLKACESFCGKHEKNGERTLEEGVKKRGGEKRKMKKKRVIHKVIHAVENFCILPPQRVEKAGKMCYNTRMYMNFPDLARAKALFEQNQTTFEAFYELLIAYNGRYNLTAITQKEEVLHKHFYDSLLGEPYFEQGAACVEIGSGAGFPSIPLMIARRDLRVTLVESTGKKCEFLRTAIRELGLSGEVVNARAEELAKDARFRERFDIAFARAVAPLASLAEYCMPFVRVGGKMIAYKGSAEEDAARAFSLLGGGKSECVRYELPQHYGARTLVLVKKERSTPSKYPRGQGKERKDPL